MATAHIPRRERQMELYPRPPEPFVPQFEQLGERRAWRRILALAGFSLLVHVVFVLCVVALIVALPKNSPILLTARELLGEDKTLRYMDLAPDVQKPKERPKTHVISDKDRIKATRNPSIDRKTLNELADNRRPGPPQAAGQGNKAAMPALPAPAQPAASGTSPPSAPANQLAQLNGSPLPRGHALPNFGGPATAGSVIQGAARAASERRGGGGVEGDYGMGPGIAQTTHRDSIEILSDTLGVDFAPYIKRMRLQVYTNWMNLIPEAARPPLRKRGMVTIEFSVLKDGSIAGLRLVGSSSDVSLDRAAYGAISASNPMPPLPADFRGDYFTVRARFYYNPDRNDLR